MSETIYIIAKKVNGPAGHGEPGDQYLALGRHTGAYETGELLPSFFDPIRAAQFIEETGQHFIIVPLELN